MAASISRLPTLGGKAAARGAAIMAERPLSDRRQALDRAIILKAAVQKAVESTAQPVRRCDAVIEEITRLRAGLASLYQRDQRLTGEWHRAHHALVDAGRGTCDASNATPDGGTRFGSECKVNRRSGECPGKATRYASADFGSAATVFVGSREGARIGLDRIERLAEVSRINAYRARRRLGGTAMMLSARSWV